ncbi:MAG: hypothetical protein ACLTNO_10175 [Blautia sp.]
MSNRLDRGCTQWAGGSQSAATGGYLCRRDMSLSPTVSGDCRPEDWNFSGSCLSVQIPVYGIGGINQNNCGQVLEQQAAGYCLMSSAMRAK